MRYQAKPADSPLAGQMVNIEVTMPPDAASTHPDAQVLVVLYFVPDGKHFSIPGLPEAMTRVCSLPLDTTTHTLMLPGYAQQYHLRACLVTPKPNPEADGQTEKHAAAPSLGDPEGAAVKEEPVEEAAARKEEPSSASDTKAPTSSPEYLARCCLISPFHCTATHPT